MSSEMTIQLPCEKPTSDIGLVIGLITGSISGAFLCGPVGFIVFAIFGMILGDGTEQKIIEYYTNKIGG